MSQISDAGEPFNDAADWRRAFMDHSATVIDETAFERRIDAVASPFWLLVKSRPVLSQSPARSLSDHDNWK